MKAFVNVGGGTAAVQDVPVPKLEQGEILVKVHYIAQNPTDWKGMKMGLPGRTLGCDFAGTVADANGSHWREGQRVAGFVQGNSSDPPRGAFAEYAVVEQSLVYAIPDSTTFQSASTISLAFATAVQALFQRLQLPEPSQPAKSAFPILIGGGSSSVGLYAIQLCKLAGLFVVATGSKRNHELLKQFGADAVVEYNDADWPEQVRQVTQDNLQHALDCIGGKQTGAAVAKALSSAKGGHLVSILPYQQPGDSSVPDKVKIETTIVYTVFDRPIPAYSSFDNASGPRSEDKALWEKYLTLLPAYLEQGKIKANPLREFGGIEDILKGFKEQEEGKVKAEKLVYKVV